MSAIYEWATAGNLQPEPITVEIWRPVVRHALLILPVGEDGEHPAMAGVGRWQAELEEDVADVLQQPEVRDLAGTPSSHRLRVIGKLHSVTERGVAVRGAVTRPSPWAMLGPSAGQGVGGVMDKSLLAVLNDAERLLVAEADPSALGTLDEDAAIELESRVRRARDKYVSQYRRTASARVAEQGGRGKARAGNARAAAKAEAFERALSQVSRRVAALARQSAAALRAERLAAARAVKQTDWPGSGQMVPKQRREGPSVTPEPRGDRALRSPIREKERAGVQASGARWQARRDSGAAPEG